MPAVKPDDVKEEQSDSDPGGGEVVEPMAEIAGDEQPVSDAVETTFDMLYSERDHLSGQINDLEQTVARQQDQIEELRDSVEELVTILEKVGVVDNVQLDWET